MFSLLDEIEEKVEALHLKVMFEDGSEAVLTDVQIYLSTHKVSFQTLKSVVSHPPKLGQGNRRQSTALYLYPT